MIFIDNNGNYPRLIGDLMLSYPKWKMGDKLPDGWILVEPTDPPEVRNGKILAELSPEIIDGKAYQRWILRRPNEEDLKRAEQTLLIIKDINRDRLL